MNKTIKACALTFLLICVNVGIFLLTDELTTSFWISYSFFMLAAIANIFVFTLGNLGEKVIFNAPYYITSFFYLIVESVIAALFGGSDNPKAAFAVQLLIFAIYVIAFVVIFTTNNATKAQQEKRGRDIQNFKFIQNKFKAVIEKLDYSDASREIIRHAYDSVASGQVKSDASVFDIEQRMLDYIDMLDTAVEEKNAEKISTVCAELERLAADRKLKLSAKPQF